ncbi:hypothetical protein TeGR_g4625 [Tetraparma gracilis]|uniref:Uncharacterized protein n=1 Tax=Tetraparma gracilis TaxID=2962635 RepID=A0ABQ6MVI5_9STRA|nr:hypothetical protein TeGR_g4625 [Tetraparma gracilis]
MSRRSSRSAAQTRRSIVRFAVPAIGVWLCNPVLSLVDTSVVGVFAGTFDQAALSPAVAITDYSMICLSFMFTATTNLIATESKEPLATGDPSPAAALLRTSLRMSGLIGFFLGSLLLLASGGMVRAMIGGGGVDARVYESAVKYVRIRALGFPAAVALGSAQSACLGLKDTRSPLIILLYAGGLNLLCDLLLVPCRFPLFSGAAGAAWATTFSQYAALLLFLRHLTRPRSPSPKPAAAPSLSLPPAPPLSPPLPPPPAAGRKESFDTKGFLGDDFT